MIFFTLFSLPLHLSLSLSLTLTRTTHTFILSLTHTHALSLQKLKLTRTHSYTRHTQSLPLSPAESRLFFHLTLKVDECRIGRNDILVLFTETSPRFQSKCKRLKLKMLRYTLYWYFSTTVWRIFS